MSEPQSAFRAAKAERSILRWVFGWHPVVGWAMVVFLTSGVGYYLGLAYELALVGLIAGGPVWYQGMRYINRHWEPLRDAYLTDVEEFGPKVLSAAGMAENAWTSLLTMAPEKRQPFVEAPNQVDATLVGLDDAGLWIYDRTSLDLMFMKAEVGTDPDEVVHFPDGNLASVTFEDGILTVEPIEETEEVRTYRTPLSAEPTELLDRVADRTRPH
jgi:hypothetical protein